MAEAPKYSDADVRAILDRALAKSPTSDGLSHAELLSIGEQVGVPREALARAAHELQEEQLHTEAQRAITAGRRRWLGYHAALFALVNALAFAVNFFTTPGEWWSLFSIVPWAFVLILHAGLSSALPPSQGAIEKQRQRLAQKRRSLTTSRMRVEPSTDSASPSAEPSEIAEPEDEAAASPRETAEPRRQ
jgi:hypothetical protein